MMENVSSKPGFGRRIFQKPVADDKKRNQFESDKRDLINATGDGVSTHKNYLYFLSNSMLIDLKDPNNPGNSIDGFNYKTYIAIPGDQMFFNFFELEKYKLWEAINAAMTLVNCVNCVNCEMCIDCKNCVDARGLVGVGARRV